MNNNQYARTLSGAGIIIIGFAALLGSFNVFNFNELFITWWPLLVVAAGLISFVDNPHRIIWPIVIISFGILFQLRTLGAVDVNPWQLFWPVVIIVLGWIIITKQLQKPTVASDKSDNLTVILGGTETVNDSKDYKGGSLTVVMGGGVLDLRHAVIKKEATIDVLMLLGGYEIKVPETWTVRTQVSPILGGVENKTVTARKSNTPVLIITGAAVLGGLQIKH